MYRATIFELRADRQTECVHVPTFHLASVAADHLQARAFMGGHVSWPGSTVRTFPTATIARIVAPTCPACGRPADQDDLTEQYSANADYDPTPADAIIASLVVGAEAMPDEAGDDYLSELDPNTAGHVLDAITARTPVGALVHGLRDLDGDLIVGLPTDHDALVQVASERTETPARITDDDPLSPRADDATGTPLWPSGATFDYLNGPFAEDDDPAGVRSDRVADLVADLDSNEPNDAFIDAFIDDDHAHGCPARYGVGDCDEETAADQIAPSWSPYVQRAMDRSGRGSLQGGLVLSVRPVGAI